MLVHYKVIFLFIQMLEKSFPHFQFGITQKSSGSRLVGIALKQLQFD